MFVNVLLPGTTPIPCKHVLYLHVKSSNWVEVHFLECSCSSANMNYMYSSENVSLIKVLKVLVLSAFKFNKCLSFILNMYFTILSFLIENQLKKINYMLDKV